MGSALLVIAIALAFGQPFFGWTSDDSFITYRFAENFAEGRGLVFNSGERVEGFSNPAWLFALASATKLGFDIVVASKVLGFLDWMTVIGLADSILVRNTRNPAFRFGLAIGIALHSALALYAFSGMETVFYAAVILVFVRSACDYLEPREPGAGSSCEAPATILNHANPAQPTALAGLARWLFWALAFC